MVLIFALMFFICICEYFGPEDDERSDKETDEPLVEVKKAKKEKKKKVLDDKTKAT